MDQAVTNIVFSEVLNSRLWYSQFNQVYDEWEFKMTPNWIGSWSQFDIPGFITRLITKVLA